MPPKINIKNILPQKTLTSYFNAQQKQAFSSEERKNISGKDLKTEKDKNKQKQEISKSNTERLSKLSVHSSKKQQPQEKEQSVRHLNVLFYENKIRSEPYGQTIDFIHKHWWKDYMKLERDHSFIQWLFPNSFQSRFNKHAKPLSLQQAEIIKKTPLILKRYKISYKMMLQFYGMKMKNDQTGEINRSRNPDFRTRFFDTLLTSFHNHMRITRILTSLTELGFGRYASELCKFLKHEIYSKEGGLKNLQKYNVYSDWRPYEKFQQTEFNTNVLTNLNLQQKPQIKQKIQQKEQRAQQNQKPQIEQDKNIQRPQDYKTQK